jgi:hypothetical protein
MYANKTFFPSLFGSNLSFALCTWDVTGRICKPLNAHRWERQIANVVVLLSVVGIVVILVHRKRSFCKDLKVAIILDLFFRKF